MTFTKWLFLTMLLGIFTGLGYDIIGPDSGTVIAVGLSTAASAIMTVFSIIIGD